MVVLVIGGPFPGIQTDPWAPVSSPEMHRFPVRGAWAHNKTSTAPKAVAPCRERSPASAFQGA